ncbi:hypothetical protein HY632_03865 [Candidatus Uhrbacteria bacterium]|nr:hypothetical protein [Candidatus Uhrbacteria bacterium]
MSRREACPVIPRVRGGVAHAGVGVDTSIQFLVRHVEEIRAGQRTGRIEIPGDHRREKEFTEPSARVVVQIAEQEHAELEELREAFRIRKNWRAIHDTDGIP